MSNPEATRAYLEGEVEALTPFAFVAVAPSGRPLHSIEMSRREDQTLAVSVPGRPPIAPDLPVETRRRLADRGFASEDPADRSVPWTKEAADAQECVDLGLRILTEVFDEKSGVSLDLIHGSRRAEHEARMRLEELRNRVERVIQDLMGQPVEQDDDGDYVLPIGDVRVVVAPRAIAGGPAIIRVFAVTNVGVTVAPELGLFLARLNFGMMFGSFALDTEHHSIWFDETILGDQLNEEALRFAIKVVASTADEWDDRLKQMFGGATYQEVLTRGDDEGAARTKPGEGRTDAPGMYL